MDDAKMRNIEEVYQSCEPETIRKYFQAGEFFAFFQWIFDR